MSSFIVILICLSAVSAHYKGPLPVQRRYKRDAVGALDIVTNNAQPIHADVKVENMAENNIGTTTATEKPCPKPYVPSSIEMGTVFQPVPYGDPLVAQPGVSVIPAVPAVPVVPVVPAIPVVPAVPVVPGVPVDPGVPVVPGVPSVTAPKDVTTIYKAKSLRKSWPLTSRLDLIRSVTRMVTLVVLIISGVLEFYPLLQHLYNLL